jgi:hypothetical protein
VKKQHSWAQAQQKRHVTAIHEAGHVYMIHHVGYDFLSATIQPSKNEEHGRHHGGYTRCEHPAVSAQEVLPIVMVTVAGLMAEQLCGLVPRNKVASDDEAHVNFLAWGILNSSVDKPFNLSYDDCNKKVGEYTTGKVPADVFALGQQLWDEATERVTKIFAQDLIAIRAIIREIAKRLKEKQTIYPADVADMFSSKELPVETVSQS